MTAPEKIPTQLHKMPRRQLSACVSQHARWGGSRVEGL